MNAHADLPFFAVCLLAWSLPIAALQAEEASPEMLEEVVVQAPAEQRSTQAAKVLDDDELRLKMGRSIGETLKSELGISSQSFGPGVGTPVIRGQAGPRVRVLSNGIGGNDASAFSPDHASSVDPLLAERIEVLRGPATLLYGSGMIGGVVNVLDNRIPGRLPDRPLGGALEQRFDSVSNETDTVMKIDGGHKHLAYHLDGFYRHHGNLDIGGRAIDVDKVAFTDPSLTVVDNTRGHLNNTGAEAISGSAGLSWIGDPGFAGASLNHLENNYGIAPNGAGDENVRIALRQSKYDFKGELNEPFAFAKKLRARLGYTDYQHTEIANGEPGAFFTHQSYEGRLELDHHALGPLRGSIGFQAQASDFNAIEKLTGAAIVPRALTESYAAFAVETLETGLLTHQFGIRIDPTAIRPDGLQAFHYTPVSASASTAWKIDVRNRLNLAVTRSMRAPQVQELLVNGYHDATRSFERGNPNLHEETSYNLDLGYRFNADWLRAEIDLFHNWAVDYIYQQRSGASVDEDGNACVADCVPVLLSRQQDAIFKGFEAKLIFPLLENRYGLLEMTLFSDYTRAQFASGGDVPRQPPLRYGLQFDHNQDKLSSFLRFTRADDQPHAGDFETSTAGYFLLNVGVDYQLQAYKDAKLMLFAKGNNLLDQNIRNSVSYLRNFAPEAGRGAEIGFRLSY